ncbi:hypothetical protein E1B28_005198 [Marasmius oreades]|uniref:NAD(P)-binding protein n=1 Tax=Marasmius oreades TaxID=181124 RepID=A0A9P7V042_9AGAR|nr:uncharacterized protein E1B28_005198 [Marasmius oreades]KAG7097885.1 hypothetical protein E1B28_005198 [Marasmius oreades]
MPTLIEVKAYNTLFQFSYIPVAVFVGGTSGIGQRTVEALARTANGKIHIIILSRSESVGKEILASLVRPLDVSINVIREFVYCDAALMKNVSVACSKIRQILRENLPHHDPPRINILFMSAGYADVRLWTRKDTEEGIDHQLSLRYYHRFKFTYELLPLLRAAKDAGEDAKVLSVLAAGVRWWLPQDDFGYKTLKDGPVWRSTIISAPYNDLAFEGFAQREPGIAFTHMNPGFVRTPTFNNTNSFAHWFLKPFDLLVKLVALFISISEEDSAQFFLYALLAGKAGFHRRNNQGDGIGNCDHGVDKEKFWKHSLEETQSG